ncbi:MAG: flagellar biosynthetic protein FliQ [Planctomycetaceae bacterium]|nr:flagellar biosynthetic protein FliQ [Planctomycetaceae bacterium]
METVAIEELMHGALSLAIVLAVPGLIVAFLVSLVAGFLQAVTQMQDQALTNVPRILLGLVALLLLLPWMLDRLTTYTVEVYGSVAGTL